MHPVGRRNMYDCRWDVYNMSHTRCLYTRVYFIYFILCYSFPYMIHVIIRIYTHTHVPETDETLNKASLNWYNNSLQDMRKAEQVLKTRRLDRQCIFEDNQVQLFNI